MRRCALIVAALIGWSYHRAHAQSVHREYGPAYIAYAGPYSASPSSAFGHLFLVLADSPDDPVPLWDVVTFTAVTSDVDPVRYLAIGIAGGFPGRYSRLAFHQKSREYELLDDRDLWLVELRLSLEQRRSLEAALDRTTGRWYPYSFFSRNCAWYLQELLAAATSDVVRPAGVVSPAGVMTAVLGTPLAGRSFVRPAASQRLVDLQSRASKATVGRLTGERWRAAVADTAWLATLTRRDRAFVQQLVQLRSVQSSVALDPPTREGIAHLRLLTATSSASSGDSQRLGRETPPPRFHPYPRARLGYVVAPSSAPRISLHLRGAMHDELDPWQTYRPASTMELLSVELSSPAADFAPRLESAVLFSQRSLVPPTWIRHRKAWMAELEMRRDGVFDAGVPHGALRIGIGQAVGVPGRLYAHGLATVAGIATMHDGAAFAPGVELGATWLQAERMRINVRWSVERDMLSWSRTSQRLTGGARFDLSTRLGIVVTGKRASATTTYGFGLDWYP